MTPTLKEIENERNEQNEFFQYRSLCANQRHEKENEDGCNSDEYGDEDDGYDDGDDDGDNDYDDDVGDGETENHDGKDGDDNNNDVNDIENVNRKQRKTPKERDKREELWRIRDPRLTTSTPSATSTAIPRTKPNLLRAFCLVRTTWTTTMMMATMTMMVTMMLMISLTKNVVRGLEMEGKGIWEAFLS